MSSKCQFPPELQPLPPSYFVSILEGRGSLYDFSLPVSLVSLSVFPSGMMLGLLSLMTLMKLVLWGLIPWEGAWEGGRDEFTNKLIELMFHGHSCIWAPSQALEGPYDVFICLVTLNSSKIF